jgi:hypothetical protein
MTRLFSLSLALGLVGLVSCGGGSGGGPLGPSNVSAQSNQYSNSSLNGTYAFSIAGVQSTATGIVVFDGSGAITADGGGGITGGTIQEYFTGGVTCQASLSGSYDVTNSSGSGTARVTGRVTSGPCSSQTTTYSLELAQAGASALFSESDNAAWSSGTALKQ